RRTCARSSSSTRTPSGVSSSSASPSSAPDAHRALVLPSQLPMQFALLGPLEANEGAGQIRFGGRKQRALLPPLLLDPNWTVATGRLVDELWGADVPESAHKMVQISVSPLRKVLPEGMLQTRPPGYAIAVDPGAIDAVRFERLRREGEAAHAAGNTAL